MTRRCAPPPGCTTMIARRVPKLSDVCDQSASDEPEERYRSSGYGFCGTPPQYWVGSCVVDTSKCRW